MNVSHAAGSLGGGGGGGWLSVGADFRAPRVMHLKLQHPPDNSHGSFPMNFYKRKTIKANFSEMPIFPKYLGKMDLIVCT